MKQIKILLSSVLTLLLITGNNASYASPHYSDYSGKPGFKANKPNMNAFKGQVRKGNVRKGNMNAFKGQARKGNAFKRNVRILPNRNSGGRLHNNGAFRERESGFFSRGLHNNGALSPIPFGQDIISSGNHWKPHIQGGYQLGETGKNRVHMDLENEEVFPKVELGPDVVTTLEHGPGIVSTGGVDAVNDNDSRISVLDIEGTGEGVIKSTGAFDIAPVGKDGFTASSEEQHISGKDGVLGGQESGWFHPVDGSVYSITNTPTTPTIIDHWVVTPKPDGALGPDVVTTLEHGPGLHDSYDTGTEVTGVHGVQQPKGVPLKFINGVWTEDLPYD